MIILLNLFNHVTQKLGLHHSSTEVRRGAGGGVPVRLRAEGPDGEAKISAAPPLLQYIHKLMLIFHVHPFWISALEEKTRSI